MPQAVQKLVELAERMIKAVGHCFVQYFIVTSFDQCELMGDSMQFHSMGNCPFFILSSIDPGSNIKNLLS
jgi:hypothetical protein